MRFSLRGYPASGFWWMDLQSALSRLRNTTASHSVSSAGTSTKVNTSGDVNAQKVHAGASTSVLDVADGDLFDFDDDDFLQDAALSFITATSTQQKGHGVAACSNVCSPSTKSLQKLRSFKFSKIERRHIDNDNVVEVIPPAKRKSGHLHHSLSQKDEDSFPQDSDILQQTTSMYFDEGDVSSELSANTSTSTSHPSHHSVTHEDFKRPSFSTSTSKPSHSVTHEDFKQPSFSTSTSHEKFKQPSFNPRMAKHKNSSTPHTPSKHIFSSTAAPSNPLTSQSPGIRTPSNKAATTPIFTTPKNRLSTLFVSTPMLQTPISTRLSKPKFPGPAGQLPNLGPGVSMDRITIPLPSTPAPASTPRLPRLTAAPLNHPSNLSQESSGGDGSDKDFTQGPWTTMLEDLDINDASSSALLQFNICQALRQAALKKLHNGKVTHLRVLIKSIVPTGKNATAVLKDPTGEILCTFHARALEDHPSELQPGTALVLRQVSMFSPSVRKHYLNITADNIVAVYSANGRVLNATKSASESRSIMEETEDASINGQALSSENSSTTACKTAGITQPGEVTKETAFFICEDEFDDLFSDVSASAFGF